MILYDIIYIIILYIYQWSPHLNIAVMLDDFDFLTIEIPQKIILIQKKNNNCISKIKFQKKKIQIKTKKDNIMKKSSTKIAYSKEYLQDKKRV